jgi:hypothetical protein
VSAAPFDALPARPPGCRFTVTIPARDEERLLEHALTALANQLPLDGEPPISGTFDCIVFANNSSDATAAVARRFAAAHPQLPLAVIEGELPRASAHVGTARKLVMDAAASRFLRAGLPEALVASTDADTVVDPYWIAQTVRAARSADAVAGDVTIGESELARLLAPVRVLYVRERAYRRAYAEAQALIDPQAWDPGPRHASFVGASFAVTAGAYAAAGGVPPYAALEDLAFSRALQRIDARIRHSLLVRATTSARRVARAEGGFGTFVDGLHAHGAAGETFVVQNPRETLDEFESRAALRRVWSGDGDACDRATIERIFNISECEWLPLVNPGRAFGAVYADVAGLNPLTNAYAPVPVEVATAVLRAASLAASANAVAPTRSKAASGAG